MKIKDVFLFIFIPIGLFNMIAGLKQALRPTSYIASESCAHVCQSLVAADGNIKCDKVTNIEPAKDSHVYNGISLQCSCINSTTGTASVFYDRLQQYRMELKNLFGLSFWNCSWKMYQ